MKLPSVTATQNPDDPHCLIVASPHYEWRSVEDREEILYKVLMELKPFLQTIMNVPLYERVTHEFLVHLVQINFLYQDHQGLFVVDMKKES